MSTEDQVKAEKNTGIPSAEMKPTSELKAAPAQDRWVFTFGFGHSHPTTGERLSNCYVVLEGDVNTTRETMHRHFGNKWSMQYPSEEKAGVHRYNLTQIDLPGQIHESEELKTTLCTKIASELRPWLKIPDGDVSDIEFVIGTILTRWDERQIETVERPTRRAQELAGAVAREMAATIRETGGFHSVLYEAVEALMDERDGFTDDALDDFEAQVAPIIAEVFRSAPPEGKQDYEAGK